MSDNTNLFRLVFTGTVLPGFSREQVVSQLQRILHLDQEKAEALVAGKPRQINKELTRDRAEKLRHYILEQGAECVLQPIDEPFVSTQELPSLDSDEGMEQGTPPSTTQVQPDETHTPLAGVTDKPANNPIVKYSLIAAVVIVMAASAYIIFRPASVPAGDTEVSQEAPATRKAQPVSEQSKPVRTLSPEEIETTTKLRNLAVRTSLWFADHGIKSKPSDVNWIWIQGDLGISVKDMSDSWGNLIKYIGKKDSFEMRSSGLDSIFYRDDDIFRETVLE